MKWGVDILRTAPSSLSIEVPLRSFSLLVLAQNAPGPVNLSISSNMVLTLLTLRVLVLYISLESALTKRGEIVSVSGSLPKLLRGSFLVLGAAKKEEEEEA